MESVSIDTAFAKVETALEEIRGFGLRNAEINFYEVATRPGHPHLRSTRHTRPTRRPRAAKESE